MKTIGSFKNFRIALLTVLSLTAVACGPRGETKTLSDVLSIAKQEFAEHVGNAGEVQNQVASIQSSLETLVNEQSDRAALSKASEEISDQLSALVTRSGYTSRPAFTELISQYRELHDDALEGSAQLNRLKLIAARTYSAVASELATTKFNVKYLNPKS